MVSNVNL